jgi:putative ABC transport system substrate-binding protein
MRRRAFFTFVGGAAVAWPFAARAQQPALPVIGFLHTGSPEQFTLRLNAYRQGLQQAGFVDGQNVAIDFRWAHGDNARLPEFAADLIKRQAAVLVALGSTPAALAAKAATATIPIVFTTGSDPVALGLVASLNRPGGNATGITALNADLAGKRLGLLRTLLPKAGRFLALVNPQAPLTEPFMKDLESGAANLGIKVDILKASTPDGIDAVFADLPPRPDSALLVSTDIFLFNNRDRIIAAAAKLRLPAIYDSREFVDAGGLISYGAEYLEVMRQAGVYTGRVLKGEKPADLPVVQSEKFELTINLKTARTLGLEVPPTLLAIADEVIE